MSRLIIIIIFLMYFVGVYTLPIYFSQNELDFGSTEIEEINTIEFYLKNTYHEYQAISITSLLPELSLSDTLVYISPQDSIFLQVHFIGKTNIQYSSILVFNNQHNHNPYYMPVTASCYLPNNLYSSTFNLYDNALKAQIFNLINNHTSIGYDNARAYMYGTLDNVDGYLQCVYTGVWVHESDIPGGTIMNCEHTWPQSLGATGTAKSDLYHLFPSDSNANSIRGNLPFGIVSGNPNWQQGGSKRGNDSQGTLVFEPRNEHKGAVSRSMIYFALRYNNPFSPFFDYQEETLRYWNNHYQVTTQETSRNDGIASVQNKRNPFIDHPEFVNRIYSISTNNQTPAFVNLFHEETIFFESQGTHLIPLYNEGNSTLTISNVSVTHNDIQVVEYPLSISSKSVEYIQVTINSVNGFSGVSLNITSNAGVNSISLNYAFVNISDDNILPRPVISVFPNPINHHFYVNISNCFDAKNYETNISIYNIKGQLIKQQLWQTSGNSYQQSFPQDHPSGIYFINIENDIQSVTKKVLYLK